MPGSTRRGGNDSIHVIFFFFNDTATTEIYTLSLHDALPISFAYAIAGLWKKDFGGWAKQALDRKSTRLNSSHTDISRMPSSACKKTNKYNPGCRQRGAIAGLLRGRGKRSG